MGKPQKRRFLPAVQQPCLVIHPLENGMEGPQILGSGPSRFDHVKLQAALHFFHAELFVGAEPQDVVPGIRLFRQKSLELFLELRVELYFQAWDRPQRPDLIVLPLSGNNPGRSSDSPGH